LLQLNKKIISFLESLEDKDKIITQIGRHYGFEGNHKSLYNHLIAHQNKKLSSWWTRDMSVLLDGLLQSIKDEINYTKLCEILLKVSEFTILRKGARVIVNHAKKINWENFNGYFHTTRFHYEIANEFSNTPENLPANWQDIMMDVSLDMSYTFCYVWKYIQCKCQGHIDILAVKKIWQQASPYQKIIIIEVWGYRRLKLNDRNWIQEFVFGIKLWPYLRKELEIWDFHFVAKRSGVFESDFQILKNSIASQYHYIFTNYYNLYDYRNQLEFDIEKISKLDIALDIALWIYRHPSWEIWKLGNLLLILKLRNRKSRNEVISWIENTWDQEELPALVDVLFQLPVFLESKEQFFEYSIRCCRSKNSQLRGSFIADLCVYVENIHDPRFIQFVKTDIIPELNRVSEDIWETQELIRLVNIIREYLSDQEMQEYVNSHKILAVIDNPFQMDFNDFWRIAESNYLHV
jgi:hypothetical protein